MIQHLNKMQQEDYDQLQKKKEAQLELMKEIDKSNKVRVLVYSVTTKIITGYFMGRNILLKGICRKVGTSPVFPCDTYRQLCTFLRFDCGLPSLINIFTLEIYKAKPQSNLTCVLI